MLLALALSSCRSGPGAESDDAPPAAPVLVSPEDGEADVSTEVELCWSEGGDDSVRYRVFLDDLELSTGKVGAEGFAGACTPELYLEPGREYRWNARAFETEPPHRSSMTSKTFRFTTGAAEGRTVFEDEFSDDQGWEVMGDATDGTWVLGEPTEAFTNGDLSQPGSCHTGRGCAFTGQNPDGDPEEADVDGGSTVLLSPPLDLGGARSATVSLARFVFLGARDAFGDRLGIELLAPDAAEPDGYRAFVLENLDRVTAAGQNAWTPMTFSACSVPLVSDMRLRITASDRSDGIVEAAIDSVLVTAYDDANLCDPGPGALCDPQDPESCPGTLLCCPRGTINLGVYRCQEAQRAIDPESPPPTPDDPLDGEFGCHAPDLRVSERTPEVYLEERTFGVEDCAFREGCVDNIGRRRLLRFGMLTQNIGSLDLTLGPPANHPELFVYDSCHRHYHFESFARYELLDADGNEVAHGRKQAQCLWDWGSFAWPDRTDGKYECFNQGLQVGWEDEYAADLDCQWLDVTDVEPGEYTLRIEVNTPEAGTARPRLVERNYDNNVTEISVTVPPQ